MNVLVTGAAGKIGTAVLDGLGSDPDYTLTGLDVVEPPDAVHDVVVGDVTDYDEVRPHFDGQDAVVHLARPRADGELDAFSQAIEWTPTLGANLRAHTTALAAAVDAGVERYVYASSHHAVGMYERDHAPAVYDVDHELVLTADSSPRPDSLYGVTKVYGESVGRLAAEAYGLRVYAVRFCNLRAANHPYADAERGVAEGRFDRDSAAYDEQVARLKASWLSHRDAAHLVDRCLQDESVTFDVFYGVSDNARRWFDIEHAREVLGYDPRDASEGWDGPPAE